MSVPVNHLKIHAIPIKMHTSQTFREMVQRRKAKKLCGDHFRITVVPIIVKKAGKPLQKETGHPLRYALYQNWCPVMVEISQPNPNPESLRLPLV